MRQDEHGSSYDYDNDASKTVTHKSSIRSSHHISAAKNNKNSISLSLTELIIRIERYIQDIFHWKRMVDLK